MTTKTLFIKKISSPFAAAKGLLLQRTPFGILFHTRWGIHTFGMRFPVDVIILDKKNTIVKIKVQLEPDRIFLWNPHYNTVLELPGKTIQEKGLTVGEKIKLEEV